MLNFTNTTGSTPTDIEALVQSGKMVEEVIKKDQEYPDLVMFLGGESSDLYITPVSSSADELLVTNTVPVPAVLLEELSKNVECRSFHGLFPEIGRAWLTVDHVLYIWNYSSPSEIYTYKDQDQIIVSAGLVKPKRGVFGEHITHLITVTTPLQVILLGLSVKASELKVYGTNLHTATDDVQMKMIKGTDEGRIFMLGNNGKPYELSYNHPGILSTPCSLYCKASQSFMDTVLNFLPHRHSPRRKIEDTVKALAIDNERKLLYLCTDDSIELIDIGGAPGNYRSVYKRTNIAHSAVQLSRQSTRTFNAEAFVLSSLHIISTVESKRVHLMATTTAGFRLYFSTYADGFRVGYESGKPECNTLVLGHIRVPSPEAQEVLVGQPYHSFRQSYYDAGIFLSARSVNAISDSIYCSALTNVAPAPPRQTLYSNSYYNIERPSNSETSYVVNVPTKVWAIKETLSELSGKQRLKEIARPLTEAPRQFMALTSTSITFYNKLRPVDVLSRMIQSEDFTLTEPQKRFQNFFDRFGKTEACAMCLSIACNIENPDYTAKAVDLFFQLGGTPTASTSSYTPGNHLGQVVGKTGVTFSGKHDGFVLYLARILEPMWELKFFELCHPANPASPIHCAKILSLSRQVRGDLDNLAQFMIKHPQFHNSANISDPRFQATDQSKLDLDLAEQKSIREAYALLTQATDAVYFIEFLLESRIQEALTPARYDLTWLKRAIDLDIRSLLTDISGRELASELIVLTINQYGSHHTHASFDVVSDQMKKYCHNYFAPKDIIFFKGMEYVRSALNQETEHDRDASIDQSLECFKQAADHLSFAKFRTIYDCYLILSFHTGIIELALERVHQLDPTQQVLTFFESGQTYQSVKNTILSTCLDTYTYALRALDNALLLRSSPTPPNHIPVKDRVTYVRRVIDAALNSKDQLFHYKLYDWFLQKGLKQELLGVRTPYLVTYFEKFVGDEEASLEFLWEYYRSQGEYSKTAQYLVRLAKTASPTLKLDRRVMLMTWASVNLGSETKLTRDETIFEAQLRQKIETAQLQQRIQNVLRSNENNVEAQVVADQLDSNLFEKDVLLKDYIAKFAILQSMDV